MISLSTDGWKVNTRFRPRSGCRSCDSRVTPSGRVTVWDSVLLTADNLLRNAFCDLCPTITRPEGLCLSAMSLTLPVTQATALLDDEPR
jgi:hypothetical protein